MNNIYIKESDIPLTRTRKAFIKSLIMQRGVITYEDPGCKIVQCENKNAYRSISELHQIVRSRFSFTSLEALLKTPEKPILKATDTVNPVLADEALQASPDKPAAIQTTKRLKSSPTLIKGMTAMEAVAFTFKRAKIINGLLWGKFPFWSLLNRRSYFSR